VANVTATLVSFAPMTISIVPEPPGRTKTWSGLPSRSICVSRMCPVISPERSQLSRVAGYGVNVIPRDLAHYSPIVSAPGAAPRMTMLPGWQRGTGPGARMPRRVFRSLCRRRLIGAYLNFPIRRRVRAIQIQFVQCRMFSIRNRRSLFRTSNNIATCVSRAGREWHKIGLPSIL
jgi:hypothetical protein